MKTMDDEDNLRTLTEMVNSSIYNPSVSFILFQYILEGDYPEWFDCYGLFKHAMHQESGSIYGYNSIKSISRYFQ